MKLRVKPLPERLHSLAHRSEVKFIRDLMRGLLNHPHIEISETEIEDGKIVTFSNSGEILDMLPISTIWSHHSRQLYPAEKGVEREVRLIGRSLYGNGEHYQYGYMHTGYEYIYSSAKNDEVRLVTHWTIGRNLRKNKDSNTFSITVTRKGPISEACFGVEIDPQGYN